MDRFVNCNEISVINQRFLKGEKINDVDNPKTRDLADIIYFASSANAE